jgi:hypothetical protein
MARAPDRPVRRDDARVNDRNRDDPRRERYRRDEDLGPSVIGFGDDVPAFMLLRPRRAYIQEAVANEPNEADA